VAKQQGNLFSRLSKLFRSGPVVRRKVKNQTEITASSAYEMFRKNVSDVYASTVSAYGSYDRMSRYSDFSEMEATPEIASALDIYAEETASQDDNGQVLHVFSENQVIQELLSNLFDDILNVNFNLPMWVRNLCKYGDFFLFNDVNPQYGVTNAYPIPISEIEREEGYDPKDPTAVRFRWITRGNTTLENWQISHFRLLGNDAFLPYGSSVLESARRIWRQLILIEDAMLVYRIVRAPERRIFYIDVGNVPPEDIETYMQQAQTSLRRNKAVDQTTGRLDLRYNPLSVDDDYFIPVRGSESGTKIETLAGGQNAAAVEDVQYIQKKLFAALKIPKAYLGYDEEIGAKATLAQEDIRFSRTISRIQKVIISELNKLAMIHLYSHGFTDDELLNFHLSLNNPSSVAQLQKLELIKTKFEIAGTAPEGAVDRTWIRKNILGLTDDEIKKIKEGRKLDKLEDSEVEEAESDGAGGVAGSSPGAPAGGGGDLGGDFDFGGGDLGGDDLGGGDEGGGDEGGGEADNLFAGDFKDGNVLGEVDEFPVKPSVESKNAFGGRRKRKPTRSSNSKAEVPDFLVMTMDKRPQSTMNEPYGPSNMKKGIWEDDMSLTRAMFGESPTPRKTPEINSLLSLLNKEIVTKRGAKRSVLHEDTANKANGESGEDE
jgi:hypothetical protein